MGNYVLQVNHAHHWERPRWAVTGFGPFDTLEEAEACLKQRPFSWDYRIAEAYTVTKYRAVKP